MSDGYVFSELDSFYGADAFKRERVDQKKANKTRIIKILFFVLAGVIIVEALLYVLVIPCMSPVKVSVAGLQSLTNRDIQRFIQYNPKSTWFSFDSAKAASNIALNSIVENVIVEKKFPDQVLIHITERQPVAVSLATINGKTVPVQIDKKGVIFSIDKGMPSGAIPLVTGFIFENPAEGMRLHARLRPLMEQIAQIQESNPEYFSAISEIRVLPKDYGTYELALYPIHSKTRVLTDNVLNVEALQYMMVVLDVIDSIDPDVAEVDLRYGSISYKNIL
ncbi:MAG TPA: FtsQ-type POTRA domain-containing protein [Treponemataceae bacterium]|jgi:cell division protein FtsQ|nr:FtsQ-type POTRA domain-containing protein [Treponemataceae bacterium]HOS29245.1 FtsQ-type POTRA domain-containing protein [Treponemataceae bacterium]HQL03619.1 FtsQ-type POTRA domain-containing protein [Treponemataceae bacterium]